MPAQNRAKPNKIRVTLYEGVTSTKPSRLLEGDASDVTETLTTHIFTKCGASCLGKTCPDKFGAAFSFAELSPGATRAAANVMRVHAAAFDVDHGDGRLIRRSMALLRHSGTHFVISSTHSHRPGAARLRVVIFTSRPILPSEYAVLWLTVNARFELFADEQTKDPARIYFTPTCPKGLTPYVHVQEGTPLDVDKTLANAPAQFKVLAPRKSGDEWLTLLASGLGEGNRDAGLTKIAGALFRVAPALSPELSFGLLHAVNVAHCKPPLSREQVNKIADSIARRQGGQS